VGVACNGLLCNLGDGAGFAKKQQEKLNLSLILVKRLLRDNLGKKFEWVYVFTTLQTGFSTFVKVGEICYD
jgi:hypothetical protein